jgi:hypothetical protein
VIGYPEGSERSGRIRLETINSKQFFITSKTLKLFGASEIVSVWRKIAKIYQYYTTFYATVGYYVKIAGI